MYSNQQGFTLTDTVIALSLIALASTTTVNMYDSSNTKAEVLITKMADVTAGLLRAKADLSCYPLRLDGLITPAMAVNTFCGILGAESWHGSYISSGTTINGSNGHLMLDNISPGLELYIDKRTVGTKIEWLLKTENLTPALLKNILLKCNTSTEYTSSRCIDIGSDQVAYVIEDNAFPIVSASVALSPKSPVRNSAPPSVVLKALSTHTVSAAPVAHTLNNLVIAPSSGNALIPVAQTAATAMPVTTHSSPFATYVASGPAAITDVTLANAPPVVVPADPPVIFPPPEIPFEETAEYLNSCMNPRNPCY